MKVANKYQHINSPMVDRLLKDKKPDLNVKRDSKNYSRHRVERRSTMQHPKPITFRSEAYLNLVRSKGCLFCGKPGPSDPHHVSLKDAMIGGKSSDLGAISLCREHHRLFHDNPAKFRETVDSAEIFEFMYWLEREFLEDLFRRGMI